MARRKGIRKSQDNNVPGMPGSTPFRPTNGGGPGMRDPRSAGQDGAGDMNRGTPGVFFGGPGGQHNPGSGQASPQDMSGGRGPGAKRGKPGMNYAGGTPGFYEEGGPGHGYQPFPGGSNGGGDNLPGFGGQFPIGGGREVGSPLNGEIPDYDFGGGGENTIGIPENYPGPGGRPAPSKGRGRGARPQRPPGRGMPSGGPGLRSPQFPGMNVPQAPGANIRKTQGDDYMNYTY